MWLGNKVGLTVSSALYSMQDWYWLLITADYLITEGLPSTKKKNMQGLQSASIVSLFATTPLHLHVKLLHTVRHVLEVLSRAACAQSLVPYHFTEHVATSQL